MKDDEALDLPTASASGDVGLFISGNLETYRVKVLRCAYCDRLTIVNGTCIYCGGKDR